MAKRKSVMAHQFSRVPDAKIQRSSFDRSHGLKTTFDSGLLIPIFFDEALPGDSFNLRMTGFARMATPIHPVMDNAFMETFFFAVPLRILWDNFKAFMGERKTINDTTEYLVPQLAPAPTPEGYLSDSLEDYFGMPVGQPNIQPNALFHRAYVKVWNEWFRHQDLQDPLTEFTGDGPDPNDFYKVLRRGKRHDYFTSCLPWPQKGDSVGIGLAGTAPVKGNTSGQTNIRVLEPGQGSRSLQSGASSTNDVEVSGGNWNVGGTVLNWTSGDIGAHADLNDATAISINQLRQAFQIQKLLERDARGGTRYTEVVRSHFGVTSPDGRQQRPEYLGGGSTPIIVNPVAQTESTTQTSPQGNLAAFATASLHNHGFTKSFTEHCVIIGLVCVRTDLTYQYGLDRMHSRRTKYDFYWPALANIGEQAVLNQEIFCVGDDPDNTNVFGYQERFGEYRYKPSKITGRFRSNINDSLDVWHFAEKQSERPLLNAAWIETNPPIKRTLAVQNQPEFIFDSYFSMRCARPMPLYGVPGLIDHF